jgi:hypothetical protein
MMRRKRADFHQSPRSGATTLRLKAGYMTMTATGFSHPPIYNLAHWAGPYKFNRSESQLHRPTNSRKRGDPYRSLTGVIDTRATPPFVRPIFRAAAGDRSRLRPCTAGPRSLILT